MTNPKVVPFTSAIQSYRHLLRACNKLFKGDSFRLNAAVTEINSQYKQHRSLADPASISEKLSYAKDIETILRHNVVQGVQSQQDPDKYHLNITKDTELGYNESIKMKKSGNRPATKLGAKQVKVRN